MKNLKVFSIIFALLTVIVSSGAANAECIGKVNVDKVISEYAKAQDVSADIKVKEAELQKFLADAQKKLKDTKSPVEQKNLEEKLTTEFKDKRKAFQDDQIAKWKTIEDNIYQTIQNVAKSKNIDVVLNDQTVIIGGIDITDTVLSKLNSTK